jgi:uracil-DNA glycosylase
MEKPKNSLNAFITNKKKPEFCLQNHPQFQTLNGFLERLQTVPCSPTVFNPYTESLPFGNLQVYLQWHLISKADILLVGEAPGYKGCRITGIPFTSGHILAHSSLYTPYRTWFQYTNIANCKENSASAVEELFQDDPELLERCVMWNAFPFHPHVIDDPQSNRAPNALELELGKYFLIDLCKIFPFQKIIAVGNKAEKVLGEIEENLHIPRFLARHPSYGGKSEFLRQIKAILIDKSW